MSRPDRAQPLPTGAAIRTPLARPLARAGLPPPGREVTRKAGSVDGLFRGRRGLLTGCPARLHPPLHGAPPRPGVPRRRVGVWPHVVSALPSGSEDRSVTSEEGDRRCERDRGRKPPGSVATRRPRGSGFEAGSNQLPVGLRKDASQVEETFVCRLDFDVQVSLKYRKKNSRLKAAITNYSSGVNSSGS